MSNNNLLGYAVMILTITSTVFTKKGTATNLTQIKEVSEKIYLLQTAVQKAITVTIHSVFKMPLEML